LQDKQIIQAERDGAAIVEQQSLADWSQSTMPANKVDGGRTA